MVHHSAKECRFGHDHEKEGGEEHLLIMFKHPPHEAIEQPGGKHVEPHSRSTRDRRTVAASYSIDGRERQRRSRRMVSIDLEVAGRWVIEVVLTSSLLEPEFEVRPRERRMQGVVVLVLELVLAADPDQKQRDLEEKERQDDRSSRKTHWCG